MNLLRLLTFIEAVFNYEVSGSPGVTPRLYLWKPLAFSFPATPLIEAWHDGSGFVSRLQMSDADLYSGYRQAGDFLLIAPVEVKKLGGGVS